MNFELMDVFVIVGAIGALIVSKRKEKIRRWGFVFDLMACIAWSYYAIIYVKTFGSIVVQLIYISAALNGIREHFKKLKC